MSPLQTCVLFCALLVVDTFGATLKDNVLPESVKICQRNEDDYSSCLQNAIQESWMTFVKGIPELEFPSIDPWERKVEEYRSDTEPFIGTTTMRNLKAYGLAKTKFLAVRPEINEDRITLELDVEIPKIFGECDYKTEGKIDSFEIGGKGHYNISMTGLKATWALEGRVENDRWIVEHFRVGKLDAEGVKIYFSDLFNGNKLLNDAALIFANEYWQVFMKVGEPILQKLSDSRLTEFVNQSFFSKVSISKIFP